jgi:hypothetical protein
VARNNQDLIDVTLNLTTRINLDWERILADPVWINIAALYGPTEDLYAPLCDYITYYLGQDSVLSSCPSTGGPGALILKGLEDIVNGN